MKSYSVEEAYGNLVVGSVNDLRLESLRDTRDGNVEVSFTILVVFFLRVARIVIKMHNKNKWKNKKKKIENKQTAGQVVLNILGEASTR